MISVDEAQARVCADVKPLPHETVGLMDAAGRVLAEPLLARRSQPPFAVSAMDGYAVRAVDVADVPTTLRQVGTVAAGNKIQGVTIIRMHGRMNGFTTRKRNGRGWQAVDPVGVVRCVGT